MTKEKESLINQRLRNVYKPTDVFSISKNGNIYIDKSLVISWPPPGVATRAPFLAAVSGGAPLSI